MQDLFIISVIVLFIIGGVIWYSYKSNKQRTKLLEEIDEIEPVIDESHQFADLFQQELKQQTIDSERFDIDADPVLDLSDVINQVPDSEPKIDLTIDSEVPFKLESEPEALETDNKQQQELKPKEWDMVIAFTIMASEGKQFSGKSIKAVFESLDLHFGDLQIFHRYVPGSRSQTLFSIANILEPGTLNPDSFATMTTPGLLIFSRLPGPVNGLAVFDDLLETARKIADKLDGILSDESRKEISQATIEAMRNRILNLNIQLQAEQNQYDNDYTL